MKKIKHIKDLQVRKMELRIKQLEQERKIRNNWNELKEDLKPRNFIKDTLADNTFTKSSKESLFTTALGFGAGLLSKKFTEMAGQKIESTLFGAVEKLINKLRPGHKKN